MSDSSLNQSRLLTSLVFFGSQHSSTRELQTGRNILCTTTFWNKKQQSSMNPKVPFARHNLHSKIRPSEMKPNLFGLIHKAPSTSSSKISTRVQKTASTVVSEDTFCCSSCPSADSKSRSNRRSCEVFSSRLRRLMPVFCVKNKYRDVLQFSS